MTQSMDRLLTAHVGSAVRPEEVWAFVAAQQWRDGNANAKQSPAVSRFA